MTELLNNNQDSRGGCPYVIFLVRGESAGPHAQLIAIHDVVERGPQAAMVFVLERDESKWLQYAIGHLPHRR